MHLVSLNRARQKKFHDACLNCFQAFTVHLIRVDSLPRSRMLSKTAVAEKNSCDCCEVMYDRFVRFTMSLEHAKWFYWFWSDGKKNYWEFLGFRSKIAQSAGMINSHPNWLIDWWQLLMAWLSRSKNENEIYLHFMIDNKRRWCWENQIDAFNGLKRELKVMLKVNIKVCGRSFDDVQY